MSHRITQRAESEADLVDHFAFIGKDNLGAARRFLQAAADTFDRLARMPLMGRSYETSEPALAEVRWFPVSGFEKYLVF